MFLADEKLSRSAAGRAKTGAMTAGQKALLATTIAAAVGFGIYEAHRMSQVRSQLAGWAKQLEDVVRENKELRQERDEARSQLAAAQRKNDRSPENGELQRLRAEVTRL